MIAALNRTCGAPLGVMGAALFLQTEIALGMVCGVMIAWVWSAFVLRRSATS